MGCSSKGNNIIDIKIKDNNGQGSTLKLTGAKEKKFNVEISSTRYMELGSRNKANANEIKINKNECKLRIDENMIFTIKASIDEIKEIIK